MDPAAISFGFFLGAAAVAIPCYRAVIGHRDIRDYREFTLTDAFTLVGECDTAKRGWRSADRRARQPLQPDRLP